VCVGVLIYPCVFKYGDCVSEFMTSPLEGDDVVAPFGDECKLPDDLLRRCGGEEGEEGVACVGRFALLNVISEVEEERGARVGAAVERGGETDCLIAGLLAVSVILRPC